MTLVIVSPFYAIYICGKELNMEWIASHHAPASVFIARVFLGMLFFIQGYDSIFKLGTRQIIATYRHEFSDRGIPRFFVIAGVYITSYTELAGGFLLIPGFLKYPALYLLGINLLVASLAFGIARPVWDMKHVFPRLLLLIFLLAVPASWDTWSIDHLLFSVNTHIYEYVR